MLSSQLGRVILSGATESPDEMRVAPDPKGGYGPLDTLLEGIADAVGKGGGDRRPDSSRSD
jgi:hypothetical protein